MPDPDHFLLYTDGPDAAQYAESAFRELSLEATAIPGGQQSPARRGGDSDEVAYLVHATRDQMSELPTMLDRPDTHVRVARPIRHGKDEVPYGITGEIVAAFRGDVDRESVTSIATELELEVLREVRHAGNAFLLFRKGVPDYDLLDAGLARGAQEAFVPRSEFGERLCDSRPAVDLNVVIPNRTQILVGRSGVGHGLEITAAPGTELRLPPAAETAATAAPVASTDTVDGVPVVVIKGLPGVVEIPVAIPGGRLFPMAIGTRGDWKGELRVTQRRGDGTTSPGYTIRR